MPKALLTHSIQLQSSKGRSVRRVAVSRTPVESASACLIEPEEKEVSVEVVLNSLRQVLRQRGYVLKESAT
jgi:hypothetical protein